ncbi:MAG: hypothetical protein JSR81_17530 [Proteobacteria bacterium]|nr:hypothetical protein [Pseudomonadota bacterium]
MIFRALFWIAVVAVLMPREPDLGLGRPGASSENLLSKLTSMITPGQPACQDNELACVAASGMAAKVNIPDFARNGLAEVRAEFEEARRERAARRHS